MVLDRIPDIWKRPPSEFDIRPYTWYLYFLISDRILNTYGIISGYWMILGLMFNQLDTGYMLQYPTEFGIYAIISDQRLDIMAWYPDNIWHIIRPDSGYFDPVLHCGTYTAFLNKIQRKFLNCFWFFIMLNTHPTSPKPPRQYFSWRYIWLEIFLYWIILIKLIVNFLEVMTSIYWTVCREHWEERSSTCLHWGQSTTTECPVSCVIFVYCVHCSAWKLDTVW